MHVPVRLDLEGLIECTRSRVKVSGLLIRSKIVGGPKVTISVVRDETRWSVYVNRFQKNYSEDALLRVHVEACTISCTKNQCDKTILLIRKGS